MPYVTELKMAVGRMVAVRNATAVVVLLSVFSAGKCNEQVPLMMWSSNGFPLPSQSAPLAGASVSSRQLQSYLSTALSSTPQNVLLFLQDKLSVDDFTMYGGVFGNKQDSAFPNLEVALQSSSSSLLLPSVSSLASVALPSLLQEQMDTAPLYLDPETLAQLRLNASLPALLIFRLPYSSGADMMSTKEVLSGNDEVIGQVLNIMNGQSVPYTAVYTAFRPSRVMAEQPMAALSAGGRSLLQSRQKDPADPYPPVEFKERGSSCILLWAENLTISHFHSGKWQRHDLAPRTFGEGVSPDLEGSFCNRTHSRLVLNYENVLMYRSFKLIFEMSQRHYKVSARGWFSLDLVKLEYDGKRASFNGSRSIYAPVEFSYHCDSVTSFLYPQLVPFSSKDNANDWRLFFDDFQIQGFNVTGKDFSYASDCAGFFSPGIWMGLLTSLLLVLVLTYGLHMVMRLHTMDRFDDPKGPAISVPQTE
ncbi:V-type proton ATPase subunit S1 [Electrophorus electricus]|uniref:ATPase H+ transporting accessory protein 1a n=1 Tax=Electrophorus electricus TaxID=8005 RepID=A0A4W4F8T5_ELEEL|nr:V-type proton ATPase subunit S1 [Electrophorus electricus]